ncbi:MAG: hypothetical protein ACT4NY_20900 [Pseudonocardiales bacterium]
MENYVTAGTHCFPQFGSFAVPGPVWPEQVGIKVAMSAAAGGLGAAALSGRPVYCARFRTLVNPIGPDSLAIHRMRMSAPEP